MIKNNKTNYLVYFIPFYGIYKLIKKQGTIKDNLFGTLSSFFIFAFYLLLISLFIFIFKDRLSLIGKKPLCNLMDDRAISISGFVFPLCYRCTFIVLSFLFLSFLLFFFKPKIKPLIFIISILGILLCGIDGVMQYMFSFESNNIRRSITGLTCGSGLAYFIFFIFNYRGGLFGNHI